MLLQKNSKVPSSDSECPYLTVILYAGKNTVKQLFSFSNVAEADTLKPIKIQECPRDDNIICAEPYSCQCFGRYTHFHCN